MDVCAPRANGDQKESLKPWNWEGRQLWTATWVLETESVLFAKTASTLKHWVTSPRTHQGTSYFISQRRVFICLFVFILGVYVIHSNQLYCGCNHDNGSTFRSVKSYTPRMAPQAARFPLAAPADFLLCKTLLLRIGYCQNIYTRQWTHT